MSVLPPVVTDAATGRVAVVEPGPVLSIELPPDPRATFTGRVTFSPASAAMLLSGVLPMVVLVAGDGAVEAPMPAATLAFAPAVVPIDVFAAAVVGAVAWTDAAMPVLPVSAPTDAFAPVGAWFPAPVLAWPASGPSVCVETAALMGAEAFTVTSAGTLAPAELVAAAALTVAPVGAEACTCAEAGTDASTDAPAGTDVLTEALTGADPFAGALAGTPALTEAFAGTLALADTLAGTEAFTDALAGTEAVTDASTGAAAAAPTWACLPFAPAEIDAPAGACTLPVTPIDAVVPTGALPTCAPTAGPL